MYLINTSKVAQTIDSMIYGCSLFGKAWLNLTSFEFWWGKVFDRVPTCQLNQSCPYMDKTCKFNNFENKL